MLQFADKFGLLIATKHLLDKHSRGMAIGFFLFGAFCESYMYLLDKRVVSSPNTYYYVLIIRSKLHFVDDCDALIVLLWRKFKLFLFENIS